MLSLSLNLLVTACIFRTSWVTTAFVLVFLLNKWWTRETCNRIHASLSLGFAPRNLEFFLTYIFFQNPSAAITVSHQSFIDLYHPSGLPISPSYLTIPMAFINVVTASFTASLAILATGWTAPDFGKIGGGSVRWSSQSFILGRLLTRRPVDPTASINYSSDFFFFFLNGRRSDDFIQ